MDSKSSSELNSKNNLTQLSLDRDAMLEAARHLIIAFAQHDKPEVCAETPRRFADLYSEALGAATYDIEADFKLFPNPGMTGVVVLSDIHFVSLCEHHLAPTFGVAHVAYQPGDYVVGYSKLKKVINAIARRPQLDERIAVNVLDLIESKLKPLGIGIIIQSKHCCIAMRSNAPAQELATVAEFRGSFKRKRFQKTLWGFTRRKPPQP